MKAKIGTELLQLLFVFKIRYRFYFVRLLFFFFGNFRWLGGDSTFIGGKFCGVEFVEVAN